MRKHGISAKRLDELHEPGVAKDNVDHFIDFVESISTKGELPKPKHSLRWHLERNKEKAFEWGEKYKESPDHIVDTCLDRFREYGMTVNANGLIYVERAVRIPDGGSNTTYYDEIGSSYLSVGECWSWKPGNAKSYCGGRGGKYVVLKGWVSPDSINWQETMYINVYPLKRETEIRLSDASGTVVEIDEVEVDGRTIPFDGPRLTRADAVKYAHNPFHVAAKYRESGRESSWPKLRYNDGEIEFNEPFLYNGKFYIFGRDFSVSRLDLNKALADGADLHDLFDEVSRESEGFRVVRMNGKWNYLTSDNRILCNEWFEKCWPFCGGFGVVRRNGWKWNYIKSDGTYLSKVWFKDCCDFKNGFGKVYRKDWKENYIKPDGTLLSNVWFNFSWRFINGSGVAKREDGTWCKIDAKGNLHDWKTGEPVAMNESLSRIISLMGRIC